MQITENFTLEEFTRNSGLRDGELTLLQVINLSVLAALVVQPVRNKFGFPVRITSGLRSVDHNTYVGGKSNSQHLTGQACDFVCNDLEMVFLWMSQNLVFDQLILEKSAKTGSKWIHVSFAVGMNRGQVFRIVC